MWMNNVLGMNTREYELYSTCALYNSFDMS